MKSLPLFCVLAALSFVSAAGAAGKQARFTLEIKVDGQQSWKAVQDYGNATIAESYKVVSYLNAIGDLSNVATMAPDFAQKQMATAARVQAKVAEAQGDAVKQPKTNAEYAALQKALAEKTQKALAACKNEMSCMMQVGQRHAQESAAIRHPSMTQAAASGAAEEDEPQADDYRYQTYAGDQSKLADVLITFNDRAEGAYADVGGMVPWTETHTASYRGNDVDRKLAALNQFEYDVRENKFYTRQVGLPGARGRYTYKDRLHGAPTVNDNAEMIGVGEAIDWAMAQIRDGVPASGSKSTVLKPARARGGVVTSGATSSGAIKVSVSWKFERL